MKKTLEVARVCAGLCASCAGAITGGLGLVLVLATPNTIGQAAGAGIVCAALMTIYTMWRGVDAALTAMCARLVHMEYTDTMERAKSEFRRSPVRNGT